MIGNRFTVWLLVSFLYFYQYIFRVLPNVISSDLVAKFGIGVDMIGQFAGVYYIGYTLIHIPVGLALDHFRPNVIFAISALLVAIGTLPTAYSSNWVLSEIGRVFVGAGSASFILGAFKLIEVLYGLKLFGRMSGFTLAAGLTGAIYGGLPLRFMIDKFGWNATFGTATISWIGIAVLCLFLLPNKPSFPKEKGKEESLWHSLKAVSLNKTVVLSGILGGFMVGPLEGFVDAWAAVFLTSVQHLTINQASLVSSTMFIGTGLGMALNPLLLEYKLKTLDIVLICGFLMLIPMIAMMFIPMSMYVLIAAFIIIGLGCGYQVMLTVKIVTLMPDRAALASAVLNMGIMIFGYFFHSAIATAIKTLSSNGFQTSYPADVMIKAIAIIPAFIVIGMIGFWIMRNIEQKQKV